MGIPFFGPTKLAARLEGSKAFFHQFAERYQIPTPRAHVFKSHQEAAEYVQASEGKLVIKAVGISAGRGVVITTDKPYAQHVLRQSMVEMVWGDAGRSVVLEEHVSGPEFSLLVLSDGTNFKTISTVRDYKALLDGDEGPNTGGMGSHAPFEVSSTLLEQIEDTIVRPTIQGMKNEGMRISSTTIGLFS